MADSFASLGAAPVSRPFGLLLLAIGCGSGVYGIHFWLTRDTGPKPEAFFAAADHIRSRHQEGDLILLVPHYATRAREHLGDLLTVATPMVLSEDLAAHRRVWVFGLFSEAERLRPKLTGAGLVLAESETQGQGITIDRYDNPSSKTVHYKFLEHLREARVHHEHQGKNEPCEKWSDQNGHGGPYGRWICPHDSDWFYVAPEFHRMGDVVRLCLWAHPPSEGRLVIRFPNVPLYGELYGRGGHTLNSSLYAHERIDLDVEVEGLPGQRFSFPLKERWRPFALPIPTSSTETGTGTRTATVSFAVSTPNNGANHFCFVADMRDP